MDELRIGACDYQGYLPLSKWFDPPSTNSEGFQLLCALYLNQKKMYLQILCFFSGDKTSNCGMQTPDKQK